MTVSLTNDDQFYTLASGQTVTSAGSLDVIRNAIRVDAKNVTLDIAGTGNGGSEAGILLDTGPRIPNPDPFGGASVIYFFYDRSSMAVNIAAGGLVTGYYGIYVRINPLNLGTYWEGGNGYSRATVDNSGSITAQGGGYALYSGIETIEASEGRVPAAAFTSVINRAGGFIGAIAANVETLTNAGTIDGGGRAAIKLLGPSIIENSGIITSSVAGIASDTLLRITNTATGVISGGIGSGFGGLELVNAGTINGNVSVPTRFGGGDGNFIDNSQGTINGSVTFYGGNDLFIGRLAANGTLVSGATGPLNGGDGIDTFAAAVSGTQTLAPPTMPTGFERLRLDLAMGANLTITAGATSGIYLSGRATVSNAANITSAGVALGYDPVQVNQPGALYRLALSNSGTLVATFDAGSDPNYGAAVMLRSPDSNTTSPMATSFSNTGSITAVMARGVALSIGDTAQAVFINSGTITAANARAVDVIMAGTSGNQFLNSGTINGATAVGFLTNPGPGPNVVTNTGLMQADGEVISVSGGGLNNQGNIVSTGNGSLSAVRLAGTGLAGPAVENYGIITSAGTGVTISSARLTNHGSIISSQQMGVEIQFGAVAIDNAAGAVIRGGNGTAISLNIYYSLYDPVTITNAGLIDGRIDLGGNSSTPAELVTNSGVINGGVWLGVGDDSFNGSLGLQQDVHGGFGNDSLKGGNGNDLFYGDWGDDSLDGGGGTDVLIGGIGNDSYTVDRQGDVIIEQTGEGTDSVFALDSFYLYANIENLTLLGNGNSFGVGNALANVITGNTGSNLLLGGGGNDTLNGAGGVDSLFGETGNDSMDGGAGIDYLVGGSGNDVLSGGNDADAIYGEDGDDTLIGGSDFQTDILVGGNGNDTLRGDSGLGDYDLMDGGAGDDIYFVDTPNDLTFEALGGGTDTVYANIVGAGYYLYANTENLVLQGTTPFGVGNELANTLTGSGLANYLLGGAGDDRLNGKAGNDVLFGEAGADTFIFDRGTGGDVIGDFQHGIDKIRLEGLGFASFAQVQANMVENGGNTAINLGFGDFIVLNGVTNAQLSAVDFAFG